VGDRSRLHFAEVGKYCSIASDVHLGLGIHPLSPFVSTHPSLFLRRDWRGWSFADRDYRAEYKPVKIGNDVWIGLRGAIKDGVSIGDGAVVAAGAVVVSDVPPYAIVGGVPAKHIRYRFSPEIIAFLVDFKWWEKGEDWMQKHWQKLHDIEQFFRYFRPDFAAKAPLAGSSVVENRQGDGA
jgi:acetyltransferase-like isoleucine patch superfamily enzyme